jgi:hypothetical protein
MKKMMKALIVAALMVPAVVTFAKQSDASLITHCGGENCSGDHGNDGDRDRKENN